MARLGAAERIDLAEALAVVGDSQLDLPAELPERERHRFRLGVATRVRDRLLGDVEEISRDLGRKVERLDRRQHLDSVAPLPHRQAVLDRTVEAQLLEGVRAELDDLVPERADVAL